MEYTTPVQGDGSGTEAMAADNLSTAADGGRLGPGRSSGVVKQVLHLRDAHMFMTFVHAYKR